MYYLTIKIQPWLVTQRMNKLAMLIALLVLATSAGVQAQSGGTSKGQAGAGPVDYARKANTSQTQGKGVPYSKDKEQQRRIEAKGGTPAANGSATPSQGNTKSGKKPGSKSGSASSGNGRNQ